MSSTLWLWVPLVPTRSFLEGQGGRRGIGSITYRPSSFTVAQGVVHRGNDSLMGIQRWNTKLARHLANKGRILKAIFRDGGPPGLPSKYNLNSNPEWNRGKLSAFLPVRSAKVPRWALDLLGEGWTTISQRADEYDWFKDVLGLIRGRQRAMERRLDHQVLVFEYEDENA